MNSIETTYLPHNKYWNFNSKTCMSLLTTRYKFEVYKLIFSYTFNNVNLYSTTNKLVKIISFVSSQSLDSFILPGISSDVLGFVKILEE